MKAIRDIIKKPIIKISNPWKEKPSPNQSKDVRTQIQLLGSLSLQEKNLVIDLVNTAQYDEIHGESLVKHLLNLQEEGKVNRSEIKALYFGCVMHDHSPFNMVDNL